MRPGLPGQHMIRRPGGLQPRTGLTGWRLAGPARAPTSKQEMGLTFPTPGTTPKT